MDDAGSVLRADIAVCDDKVRLLPLLLRCVGGAGIERLIVCADELLPSEAFHDLIGGISVACERPEDLIEKLTRKHIVIAVRRLYLTVLELRMDAERGIGGKRPGSRRPGEEVKVPLLCLEADNGGALCQLPIALGDLMGGERRPAAGAVGNDLKALIEELLLPDLL